MLLAMASPQSATLQLLLAAGAAEPKGRAPLAAAPTLEGEPPLHVAVGAAQGRGMDPKGTEDAAVECARLLLEAGAPLLGTDR